MDAQNVFSRLESKGSCTITVVMRRTELTMESMPALTMGYSDAATDDAFEGDPDMYWNIDGH